MASKTPDLSEKRIHPRYSVDFASFAIFRLDNTVLPGLIVDISMGGLAFFYLDGENWPTDLSERYTLFGEDCSIDDVPLIVVSDLEVNAPGNPAYDYLIAKDSRRTKVRRRGVQFGSLSERQERKLKALIQEFHDYSLNKKSKPPTIKCDADL